MKQEIVKMMCDEIITKVKECKEELDWGDSYADDWYDKINEVYKILC